MTLSGFQARHYQTQRPTTHKSKQASTNQVSRPSHPSLLDKTNNKLTRLRQVSPSNQSPRSLENTNSPAHNMLDRCTARHILKMLRWVMVSAADTLVFDHRLTRC
jgi:hypothetical protein